MNPLLAQNPTPLGKIELTPKGFTKPFGVNPAARLEQIISSVVAVFTIFAGLAFLVLFISAAVTWITSGGKPETLDRAKNQMSTALVGMFITVTGTALIWLLGKVTGLDILNPADILDNLKPK